MSLNVESDIQEIMAALIKGREALSSAQEQDLQGYLRDLAMSRGFPLHPAVCFNALCWNFDLEMSRYCDAPLDDMVRVHSGERRDALPVGAFVKVPAGRGSDEFWGEIVYKEGRRSELSPDEVDAQFSGAPAPVLEEGDRRINELCEALVVDFEAIEEPNQQGLERQRERGVVMDSRRHIVHPAIYDEPEAQLDDATYFARWTVRHLGAELRRSRFGVLLADEVLDSDKLLGEALVAALSTLRVVMRSAPNCAMWRDFLFDLDSYEERLNDFEIPVGRSDLDAVAAQLARAPRNALVEYRPLGPRLAQIAGETADLNGPLWASAICHASYYLTQWLAQHAPEGVYVTQSKQVHLRLDDAWQWGGIWRIERLIDASVSYCAIAPDVPLGLGYLESTGALVGEALDDEDSFIVVGDVISRGVTLSVADIHNDRLSLVSSMIEEMRAVTREHSEDTVVVRIAIEGIDVSNFESVHHARLSLEMEASSLIGVLWPPQFVAGSRVTVSWARTSTVVDVDLGLREEPFLLGELPYIYDCDPRVFLRANGVGEPLGARGRSLRDMVLDVFRHRAQVLEDQRRATTLVRMTWAIYGPDAPVAARESIRRLLDELCDEGVISQSADQYLWAPDARVPRVGDFVPDDDVEGPRRQYVIAYEVEPFLRALVVSSEASPERKAQYQAYRKELGFPSWLPAELPRGKTFVRAHERGHRPDLSNPSGIS
jgi:hypothetical protein